VKLQFNTEANPKFMRSMLHQYDVCVVAAGARVDMTAFAQIEGRERLVDALDVASGKVKAGRRVVVLGGNKWAGGRRVAAQAGRRSDDRRARQAHRGGRHADLQWRHTAWVEELGIAR